MNGPWAGRAVYLLAMVVVTAGLTHLSVILALPGRSRASAYAVLAAPGATTLETLRLDNRFETFADPALASAACLYDLRQGPVSASLAVTGSDFAVLSVHDRHGRVLAGSTSRSARSGEVGLSIASPNPGRAGEGLVPGSGGDLLVEASEPLGFILAEVLATEPSTQENAAAIAAALTCRPANR